MSTPSRIRLPALALLVALGATCVFSGTAAAGDGRQATPVVTSERTPDMPPPTMAELAVRYALETVGTPYRWGGESPSSGFYCSGLVRWAYGRVGVDLPHSSDALFAEGRRVREGNLAPGDILFFEGLGHVGLYLGGGRMVHAPQTGRRVEIVRLGSTNYGARLIGARRVAV